MSDPATSPGNEEAGNEESIVADDVADTSSKAGDHVVKPSTEKEPGEEVEAPPERENEEEPSHEAVGIGVLDASGKIRQTEDDV